MTEAPFSLLLPVYGGDRAAFLDRSLRSAVDEQTRPPSQVVIVQDGPVGEQLTATIAQFCARTAVSFRLVELQRNTGLGPALDAGLEACEHDIVARQDADDISLPDRFERQLPLLEAGAELVGSGLLEFAEDETAVLGRRTPPIGAESIRASSGFRDPFNHPTVVYRRAAVRAVGGYQSLPLMEDYWLFVRMLASGVVAENLPDPLVLYRVGAGAYARRGGRELLRSEVDLQRRMRAAGYVSAFQYARNVLVRGGYRLVPEPVRRTVYRRAFTVRPAS